LSKHGCSSLPGARQVIDRKGLRGAVDRRTLLASTGVALGAVSTVGPGAAQGTPSPPVGTPAPSPADGTPPPPVTGTLARYIVSAEYSDLPENVRKEGVRTLFNWFGVAIGGSHDETVNIAVQALAELGGNPEATLLGRRDRLDLSNAAFVNGVSSHVFDFDDTHLKTIIHPAGPVAPALLAYAERRAARGRPVSGTEFLTALIIGIEVECRIGNMVYPDHYDAGWHITGTTGVFGSAAGISRLMGLDEERTSYALGLAASQPVGLRESFGSMNKSFNPGRAAANGLFAATLAEKGFTSSRTMIEAKRGWASTISTKQDYSQITNGLGVTYESALNTYKPFACGIVLHPIIDAVISLRNEYELKPAEIARIDMQINRLVIELTGKPAPATGLEGKFSVYHAAAVALLTGMAGEHQFTDAVVNDPTVVALRARVFPTVDPAISTEQADVTITLASGRVLQRRVEHAIGSLARPMSDQDLERKFADLAQGILPAEQARRVMDLCWQVESADDVSSLALASVPV